MDDRSFEAKELNGWIKDFGPEFGFARAEKVNEMRNNGVVDVVGEEFLANKIRDLKKEIMTRAKKVIEEDTYTAELIETSWSEDGNSRTYDLIEIIHQTTRERFIAEIGFSVELPKTIAVPEVLEDKLPHTFVGTSDDLRRVVSAISESPVDDGRLAKWLSERKS